MTAIAPTAAKATPATNDDQSVACHAPLAVSADFGLANVALTGAGSIMHPTV